MRASFPPGRRLLAVGAALVVSLTVAPSALAQTDVAVVRVTDTSTWNRPSPDPSGIAYQAATGRLLVVDSEVDETPLFAGSNAWFTSPLAHPSKSWSTLGFSDEPTDVWAKGRRTLLFTDDVRRRVFILKRGRDRRFGTSDDRVRSFRTRPFGSRDPEGIAMGRRLLFIADGQDSMVYRLHPGKNGRFDGVAPQGDDVLKGSFDTLALGLLDPKGITYDPVARELYLISRPDDLIVRTTPGGVLIEAIDISSIGMIEPSGIALAPGSDDPSVMHLFVTDKGVDNDVDPDENDGRVFELALAPA